MCSNWWKWKFTKPSSLFATDRQAMLSVLGSSRHSVRSQADKGHFLVICRDFFGSVWMIIFIIHSVFVLYFLVEIAMVKFTILHPAFKLFFSGCFQYFSQSIAKIDNPYFLSLGRSDEFLCFVPS